MAEQFKRPVRVESKGGDYGVLDANGHLIAAVLHAHHAYTIAAALNAPSPPLTDERDGLVKALTPEQIAWIADIRKRHATHNHNTDACHACQFLRVIDSLSTAVAGWQSIESAPRDGSEFLAFQDGEYYRAKYIVRSDGKRDLCFRTHQLFEKRSYRKIKAAMDGNSVDALVEIDKPWAEDFEHHWTFWTRGFVFKPTHWQPLPSPPDTGKGQG